MPLLVDLNDVRKKRMIEWLDRVEAKKVTASMDLDCHVLKTHVVQSGR